MKAHPKSLGRGGAREGEGEGEGETEDTF